MEVLDKEFSVLWRRYGSRNDSRFDPKNLLEQVSRYEGLPGRAADNNIDVDRKEAVLPGSTTSEQDILFGGDE